MYLLLSIAALSHIQLVDSLIHKSISQHSLKTTNPDFILVIKMDFESQWNFIFFLQIHLLFIYRILFFSIPLCFLYHGYPLRIITLARLHPSHSCVYMHMIILSHIRPHRTRTHIHSFVSLYHFHLPSVQRAHVHTIFISSSLCVMPVFISLLTFSSTPSLPLIFTTSRRVK